MPALYAMQAPLASRGDRVVLYAEDARKQRREGGLESGTHDA